MAVRERMSQFIFDNRLKAVGIIGALATMGIPDVASAMELPQQTPDTNAAIMQALIYLAIPSFVGAQAFYRSRKSRLDNLLSGHKSDIEALKNASKTSKIEQYGHIAQQEIIVNKKRHEGPDEKRFRIEIEGLLDLDQRKKYDGMNPAKKKEMIHQNAKEMYRQVEEARLAKKRMREIERTALFDTWNLKKVVAHEGREAVEGFGGSVVAIIALVFARDHIIPDMQLLAKDPDLLNSLVTGAKAIAAGRLLFVSTKLAFQTEKQ